jgi:hypothetical protein
MGAVCNTRKRSEIHTKCDGESEENIQLEIPRHRWEDNNI